MRNHGPVVTMVALYLLTAPTAEPSGVYPLPVARAAEETGLPAAKVENALGVLERLGFATWRSGWVFVARMAHHQGVALTCPRAAPPAIRDLVREATPGDEYATDAGADIDAVMDRMAKGHTPPATNVKATKKRATLVSDQRRVVAPWSPPDDVVEGMRYILRPAALDSVVLPDPPLTADLWGGDKVAAMEAAYTAARRDVTGNPTKYKHGARWSKACEELWDSLCSDGVSPWLWCRWVLVEDKKRHGKGRFNTVVSPTKYTKQGWAFRRDVSLGDCAKQRKFSPAEVARLEAIHLAKIRLTTGRPASLVHALALVGDATPAHVHSLTQAALREIEETRERAQAMLADGHWIWTT